MVIESAYALREYREVMRDTWGHLAPKERQKYAGTFAFAVGCYGGIGGEVTACAFDGLDDSPWFYEALQEYVSTLDMEAGCIYRFEGVFCDGVFSGKTSVILDTNL